MEIDYNIILLVVYVLLALVFSFLCSIAEAVLLSITPAFIEDQKKKRPKRAALLKKLKQDSVDRSLAAILSLNTIAHTVGAIGAGAQATIVMGSKWFGLFSAFMTLMILFLSEIVPKTIGAVYWTRLAGMTALFVYALINILYPIVWISEKLTKFISHGQDGHFFSRDEFIAMARVGEQSGHIKDNESRIIRNLFRLDNLKVNDIMTPRSVIAALPENKSVDEIFEYATSKPFSRFPVYGEDIDDISGFVLKDDILLNKARGESEKTLSAISREVLFIPETVNLLVLLESLVNDRNHLAVVIDEYGRTAGVVTLEDLFETLMGIEIVDEMDQIENLQNLARKLWKERAKKLGIEDENTDQ